MNFVVKCITKRYAKVVGETNGHVTTCMLKMLVFFINFPMNDFDHLIQLLALKVENDGDSIGIDGVDIGKANSFFPTMMGGSFYNHLLPK
jgi:hypothetical protein